MKKYCLLAVSIMVTSALFAHPRIAGDSVADLRAAVEAHPDDLALHQRFIKAFEASIPGVSFTNVDSVMSLLKPQYDEWIKRFPQSAVVPFAIGHAFAGAESPSAKPYLLKAIAMDPKIAEAYADLAIDAERWGDFDASDNYLKKAAELEPNNADYASSYAFAMDRTDFAKYREMSLDVARRFPASERGAQMLYWLAYRTPEDGDRDEIYRMLKNNFAPAKFNWSIAGMSNYFDFLLSRDPKGALSLAKEMRPLATDDFAKRSWDQNLAIAEKVAKANELVTAGHAADAVKILATVHPDRYSGSRETVAIEKARAIDGAGKTAVAEDSLIAFFAKEPSDETHEKIVQYAAKMGKDAAWADNAIEQKRQVASQAAPIFELYAYQSGQQVSLKDYRGKVVLLTFWFPGCGPCRGEFPHFQEVLNKFIGQDIAYIGINVALSQDPYVLPFTRTSGYTFTALRDKDQWAEKAYHVRGEPSNYLIDRDGRIIFSSFMIQNPKAQRMLELMISSLLAKKA